MSFFNDLVLLPDDPILSLPIDFAMDPRPLKVNLGIGVYKTAEGASLVLNSVRKAESMIIQKNLPKDYLPIEGDKEFLTCGLQLLFGAEYPFLPQSNLFSCQTIGGTGALRVGADFLSRNISRTIFIPQPSWPNHKLIFERAQLNVGSYPYYDAQKHQINFSGMCEAIQNMPPASIIVLHACCHNPTGFDPTPEQWRELSTLIKQQKLIPLFDVAYQGFGQTVDEDAQAVRTFLKDGHEMLICYSFAKNFGLYGERVGFLTVVSAKSESVPKIASQIKTSVRGNYSMPGLHGARIVKTILKSPELTQEWQAELENMRERIQAMRSAFMATLLAKGADLNVSHRNQQYGLFCFCGLTPGQVQRLRVEKGIYLPSNGRINLAGLNMQNIEYVVNAIVSIL